MIAETATSTWSLFWPEHLRNVRQYRLRYRLAQAREPVLLDVATLECDPRGNHEQAFSLLFDAERIVRSTRLSYPPPNGEHRRPAVRLEVLGPRVDGRWVVLRSMSLTKPFKLSSPSRYVLTAGPSPAVTDVVRGSPVSIDAKRLADLAFADTSERGILTETLDFAIATGGDVLYDAASGMSRTFPEHVRVSGSISVQRLEGQWLFLFGGGGPRNDKGRSPQLIVADEQRVLARLDLDRVDRLLTSGMSGSFWDPAAQQVLLYNPIDTDRDAEQQGPDSLRVVVWSYGSDPHELRSYTVPIADLLERAGHRSSASRSHQRHRR